jgi:hypothetical protein
MRKFLEITTRPIVALFFGVAFVAVGVLSILTGNFMLAGAMLALANIL